MDRGDDGRGLRRWQAPQDGARADDHPVARTNLGDEQPRGPAGPTVDVDDGIRAINGEDATGHGDAHALTVGPPTGNHEGRWSPRVGPATLDGRPSGPSVRGRG